MEGPRGSEYFEGSPTKGRKNHSFPLAQKRPTLILNMTRDTGVYSMFRYARQWMSRRLRKTRVVVRTTVARCILAYVMLLPSTGASFNEGGANRYQIILDKRPFGAVAQEEPSTNAIRSSAPALQHWRLTAMVDSSGDCRAGLVDQRSNQSFLLAQGDKTLDGVELVEIRPESGSVILAWQGSTFVLNIEDNSDAVPREQLLSPDTSSAPATDRASTKQDAARSRREAMEARMKNFYPNMPHMRSRAKGSPDR